jgi:hypothetical protein
MLLLWKQQCRLLLRVQLLLWQGFCKVVVLSVESQVNIIFFIEVIEKFLWVKCWPKVVNTLFFVHYGVNGGIAKLLFNDWVWSFDRGDKCRLW